MNKVGQIISMASAAIALLTAQVGIAQAQSLEKILKGKRIAMYISSGAGGTYDTYSRVIARHMGKFLPGNPKILPRNMPGASGLKATRYLYHVAPKDGTAMASLNRAAATMPLLGVKAADFDARKLNWLGSPTSEVSAGIFWHTSKVKTLKEAMKTPIAIGSSGVSNDSGAHPRVLNFFIGTKFKVIHGYKNGPDISLALERGEVYGRLGWSWGSIKSRTPNLIPDGKMTVFIQNGLKKARDLPNVPFALDFAKNDADRRAMEIIFAPTTIGWPYAMPPSVPSKTVAIFRAAFDSTMKDPGFVNEAKKRRLAIDPVSGKEIHAILDKIYSYPEVDKALARKAFGSGIGGLVKVKLIKVTGVIAKINKKKSRITLAGNETIKGRVSRRTKIKVAGKKAKRKALKKGMTCSMRLVASGAIVHSMSCK